MLYGKEHVKRYQETDGKEGYDWEKGTTILLLHTTGRKSGKERIHPLIFREWDGRLPGRRVQGRRRRRPGLVHEPRRRTPRSRSRSRATSSRRRPAPPTPAEKPAMWQHMVEAWPDYSDYQKKTEPQHPGRGARAGMTSWGMSPQMARDRR